MEGETREIAERLREAGLKLTAQRLAILQCLVGDETHPTAQELYDRLKPSFPTMSFATVYNTLSALSSIGALHTVQLGGAARFDPNVHPHDHFVCEGCAIVRDIDRDSDGSHVSADLEHAEQAASLRELEVHRVERIYRGLCASCRKTREGVNTHAHSTKRE